MAIIMLVMIIVAVDIKQVISCSGFDQHSKYRQHVMTGKRGGNFRIREAKRRPLTTKNVSNMLKQTQMQMQKSMQGRG